MIYIFNPHVNLNAFAHLPSVDLYDPLGNYTKNDIIFCPVIWELWSIEAIINESYREALLNKDFEHICHGIITPDIKSLISKHRAKLLLYQEWECRDLLPHHNKLKKFTTEYLKMPVEDVYYSTSEYMGHMKIQKGNIVSFDWQFAKEQTCFNEENIVPRISKKDYRIISLNYRSTAERFAYCLYMYSRHRHKFMFSYLQKVDINIEHFKKVLGDTFSNKNLKEFNDKIPMLLDGEDPDQHQVLTIKEFLANASINVVFETNWEGADSSAEQISEKTYKSIKIGKPFLLFTTKGGVLAHLRKLGFKTFAPYLNEEYDNPKLTYMTRYSLLLKESDRICNLSDVEMQDMEERLDPIVNYNLNHLQYGIMPDIFDLISRKYRNPLFKLRSKLKRALITNNNQ